MEIRLGLRNLIGLFCVCALFACSTSYPQALPRPLKGVFTDDYGINYTIDDNLWIQHPDSKYTILDHSSSEKYILTQNAADNKSFRSLYTRIDYMYFEGMEPYTWGFCLTMYEATSEEMARKATGADRLNPLTGCNGFPFSRMKISQ